MPLLFAFFIGIALMQSATFDLQTTETGSAAEKNQHDTMRELERYRWFSHAASLKLQAEGLPEGSNTASYAWGDMKNHPSLPGFVKSSPMPDSWRVKASSQGWVVCSDLSETALSHALAHLPPNGRDARRLPVSGGSLTLVRDPFQTDPDITEQLAQLCA